MRPLLLSSAPPRLVWRLPRSLHPAARKTLTPSDHITRCCHPASCGDAQAPPTLLPFRSPSPTHARRGCESTSSHHSPRADVSHRVARTHTPALARTSRTDCIFRGVFLRFPQNRRESSSFAAGALCIVININEIIHRTPYITPDCSVTHWTITVPSLLSPHKK